MSEVFDIFVCPFKSAGRAGVLGIAVLGAGRRNHASHVCFVVERTGGNIVKKSGTVSVVSPHRRKVDRHDMTSRRKRNRAGIRNTSCKADIFGFELDVFFIIDRHIAVRIACGYGISERKIKILFRIQGEGEGVGSIFSSSVSRRFDRRPESDQFGIMGLFVISPPSNTRRVDNIR